MRIALSLVLLCGIAAAADPEPATIDITAAKAKLKVLGDGKNHFIVINPETLSDEFFFFGDGKKMWGQRTGSGGRNGDDFHRNFWEPRIKERYKASFEYREKKYQVQCDDRKTEFKLLPDDEAKKILDGAKFHAPRWKHRAYALARDNTGKYFYVDKEREPEDSKKFRVWAGQKGAMKLQKLTNIANDSEGDVFSTKSGSLRVVLGKNESSWVLGNKPTKLISLAVEDNVQLIYAELGVYLGQPLGTPCDEL